MDTSRASSPLMASFLEDLALLIDRGGYVIVPLLALFNVSRGLVARPSIAAAA